jgi:phage host-nuclease inhibitor protein Gam
MSDIEAEKVPKSMDDEKIKAANAAAAIVKNLSAKIKAMKKKDDEYEKKMKALKQYIQNNRSILTKVGTIKNLTGDLIS